MLFRDLRKPPLSFRPRPLTELASWRKPYTDARRLLDLVVAITGRVLTLLSTNVVLSFVLSEGASASVDVTTRLGALGSSDGKFAVELEESYDLMQ